MRATLKAILGKVGCGESRGRKKNKTLVAAAVLRKRWESSRRQIDRFFFLYEGGGMESERISQGKKGCQSRINRLVAGRARETT